MLGRLILMLGMSVSLAVSTPVVSAMAAPTKAEAPVVKKKPVAKKSAQETTKKKQAAKADAKKKQAAKADAKKNDDDDKEKPKGLFATLFGGPIKDKDSKAKPAAKPAKEVAKKKAEPEEPKKLPPLKPIAATTAALSAEDMDVISNGNNGELRSDDVTRGGIMASLFGAEDQMLSQTRALDSALRAKNAKAKKPFTVAEKYMPQTVEFSGYPVGTIVVDTSNHFLYLVESRSSARRYGIAVGKDGLKFKGNVTVADKQEWPRWIPTQDMQKREPKKYGQYAAGMPGGGQNPLGARAIYLYQGKKDTHLRIHGTIAPQTIGTDSSNGCFRMVNEHVMDLYRRVRIGTNVVVL